MDYSGKELKLEVDKFFTERDGWAKTENSQKMIEALQKAFIPVNSVFVSQVKTLPIDRQFDVFYNMIQDTEHYLVDTASVEYKVSGKSLKTQYMAYMKSYMDSRGNVDEKEEEAFQILRSLVYYDKL